MPPDVVAEPDARRLDARFEHHGTPAGVDGDHGAVPVHHRGTIGQRVLVAWDASREATRAVNDAIPLLAGASAVTVSRFAAPGKR